jgi:hypothetical protein
LLGNEQQQQAPQAQSPLISQAQLSQLLQQQLGYSLTVRPSQIDHQEAGEEVRRGVAWQQKQLAALQACIECALG